MEHTVSSIAKGKYTLETLLESIRAVGQQNCILSTDLGQPKNGYPDEELIKVGGLLIENGISYEDVRKMMVDNPRELVA